MISRILAFAGSSRAGSFNKKLVKIAATGVEETSARVTVIDLADYPMPIFDQDLEEDQGMPEHARRFKQLLIEHGGLLIASPEYNSAFSPLLKNVIDWASRAESEDEPPLAAFRNKTAAIMATSPGPSGGLRGLVFLRMLLGNIGITVLPVQQTIPKAFNAFGDNGLLLEERKQQSVLDLGRQLATVVSRLKS